MKAFFLFVACSASVHAAASESDVAKLIAELPPQHVLSEARAMLVPADGMEDSDTKATASQLAAAKKVIEKAKEIIPKLRKLIKVGSAISDYPGLLGRGDIRYNERGQEIYLGVYLRGTEGSGPYDFKVVFDRKGTILAVENVVWKS